MLGAHRGNPPGGRDQKAPLKEIHNVSFQSQMYVEGNHDLKWDAVSTRPLSAAHKP